MATLQKNLLTLATKIDPIVKGTSTTATTARFTLATVGVSDGTRFPKQRLLDIYNEARIVLFNALRGTEDFGRCVSGAFIPDTSITFSASGSYVVASKPTGYIDLVSLVDASNVPIYVLDNSQKQELKSGNPDFVLSATNLYAFETGTQFRIPGTFGVGVGTIDYYGLTSWVLTDVTTGTAVEVFSPDIEPILIELGCALANEQSNADVLSLAKTLLNKKG